MLLLPLLLKHFHVVLSCLYSIFLITLNKAYGSIGVVLMMSKFDIDNQQFPQCVVLMLYLQLVLRPDVVEMHDVTSRDPKLLVHLKVRIMLY